MFVMNKHCKIGKDIFTYFWKNLFHFFVSFLLLTSGKISLSWFHAIMRLGLQGARENSPYGKIWEACFNSLYFSQSKVLPQSRSATPSGSYIPLTLRASFYPKQVKMKQTRLLTTIHKFNLLHAHPFLSYTLVSLTRKLCKFDFFCQDFLLAILHENFFVAALEESSSFGCFAISLTEIWTLELWKHWQTPKSSQAPISKQKEGSL